MGRKRDMLDVTHPELCEEWDYEKNDKFPSEVSRGQHFKAWWKCKKCSRSWDAMVYNRAQGNSCPYCSGQKVDSKNALSTLYPELVTEWHPTLNDKTPDEVTSGSGYRAYWICKEGHEWDATVKQRAGRGNGCPTCAGKIVLVGFNDIWTTNPELASLLSNPEDGYKNTQNSSEKADWKCQSCNSVIKNKKICNIKNRGLSCPACSDGISFPEKLMYAILKSNEKEFEFQKIINKNNNYRYDFYLPNENAIIEVHGRQHYEQLKNELGELSLEEVQKIDEEKRAYAIENGIQEYYIVDARFSKIDFIINSINKEQANWSFHLNIDMEMIKPYMTHSLLVKSCELWNVNKSMSKIAEEMGIDRNTVTRYIKRGAKIGLCDYCPIEQSRKGGASVRRKVVSIDFKGNSKVYLSITEASKEVGITGAGISLCCSGKQKTAGGFKWMYKEDFDQMIANQQKEIS